MNRQKIITAGKKVIAIEAQAILDLDDKINDNFVQACHLLYHCQGRIVVIGMGKSGHIGGKIAATLASTGSPAFFVHPGEASHGDLGMITDKDVVLALSNSGETAEMLTILPLITRLKVPLLSLTGNENSTLATTATLNLLVKVKNEACPLDLAPTSSTTAALAIGDALAVALLEQRGFTAEDFALSHPGGVLGRKLLLKVQDVMHTESRIPQVSPDVFLPVALLEMTKKGLGMTAIVNQEGYVKGIFTDGDLRRTLDQQLDIHKTKITQVMTTDCIKVTPTMLAVEALTLMNDNKITVLLVLGDDGKIAGALNMHDLIKAGIL